MAWSNRELNRSQTNRVFFYKPTVLTLIGGSGNNHEVVLASGRCSTSCADGITGSKRTIDISIRQCCLDIGHIPL